MTISRLPLTNLPLDQVSPAVLVCGDPERATQTAAYLERAELISDQREYRAYHGYFEDMPVVVCSHGIGSPGAAIAFEELIRAGGQRLIRVGTCGALQPGIQSGHLIIATAAVQNTGYGRETVPEGYPAVADVALTQALQRAAAGYNYPQQSGIVLTRDNFYKGVAARGAPDYKTLSEARVLAVEMECAALFIVGSLRAVQTAAILTVDGNVLKGDESIDTYDPHQEVVAEAVGISIQIALRGVRLTHDESD